MKMRLVRTTPHGFYPTYALLYLDGTMIKDMNLSRIKYAWQRECRDRDVFAVFDFIANCNHPEQLSALKYSKLENKIPAPSNDDREGKRLLSTIARWDITPDGEKLDDIASWGGSRVTNMIVLDDDNHLIISNENILVSCLQAKPTGVDQDFVPDMAALHSPAPLKMRLVRTGENMREGVYLLFEDGTMDSSISISETNPESLNKLRKVINNYCNGVSCTSETGERWDTYYRDMACWGGANAINVMLVTNDGKMIVSDPALLLTLRMQRTSVVENSKSRPEYITLRQYCDICLKLGLYDDKFRGGKKPIDMRDPVALKERMRVEYIRILGVAKKSAARDSHEGDGYLQSWQGFPAGAITTAARIPDNADKGRKTYFVKIYYPDANNKSDAGWYFRSKGDGVNPCLPRYPYEIGDESRYEPVILSGDIWQWVCDENRKVNAPSTDDIQGYARIDKIYQDSRELNDKVANYKAEGKTLQETVDIICKEKYGDGYDTEKREKVNISVERRWGKIKERRTAILNSAFRCDSKAEISSETGYTENYVLQILSQAVNNSRFSIVENERGLQTAQEIYDALSETLKKELAEYERNAVKECYEKGIQDAEAIAQQTKINLNTVAQVLADIGK